MGDKDAYRTLNALLFEGIENEKERIYKEKRKLNPVFIELIENTLDIYRGIFAVMCRKTENQLSVSKVKMSRSKSIINGCTLRVIQNRLCLVLRGNMMMSLLVKTI